MDKANRTELHYVPSNLEPSKQKKEIDRLIEKGLDINAQDAMGWSALHFAASNWAEDAANALIAHGANLNTVDSHGNTALSRAVFSSEGRGELIQLLLAAGADPDIKNNAGISARELAEKIANYNTIQFFS